MNLESYLEKNRIIICCGSGGVGKTSVVAAISLYQAYKGKKTICLTIDPARRLINTLGLRSCDRGINRIALPDSKHSMYFQMLDSFESIKEMIPEINSKNVQQFLNHPLFYEAFKAFSGSPEFLALKELYSLSLDTSFDTIIVDTPPTKDAINFLSSPERLVDFFENNKIVRNFFGTLFFGKKEGKNIFSAGIKTILQTFDKIIGIEPLKLLLDFGNLAESLFNPEVLKERIGNITTTLKSEKTGFIIVSAPKKISFEESSFFRKEIIKKGLNFGGYIVNKVFPKSSRENQILRDLSLQDLTENPVLNKLVENYQNYSNLINYESDLLVEYRKDAGREGFVHLFEMLPKDIYDLDSLILLSNYINRGDK